SSISSTTIVSTTATSCTSTTTSSSSASSSSSSVTNGMFSYQPTSPLKILSVAAVTDTSQNGSKSVTFRVLFENVGVVPIYVIAGCGSALNSTILQTSPVLEKISGGPLCECAEILLPRHSRS